MKEAFFPFSRHGTRVHFWTDRDVSSISDWNPDDEPDLYASGYGHTFLELFVRMLRSDRQVSIGPRAPAGVSVIVASLEELTSWLPRCEPSLVRGLARTVLRTGAPLVVIRADVHPHIPSPPFTSWEIVPTRGAITEPAFHTHLPLLPQRGLIPRSIERGEEVRTVVLKAYRKNVPTWLTDEFTERVSGLDLTIRVDTEDGDSPSWADFSDADVVLCSQPDDTLGEPSRKPATKLVNAWCAGAIPLVVPVLPYAEIGAAGQNMVTADSPEDVLEQLSRLATDPQATALLFAGVRTSATDYEPHRVTDLWWQALTSAPRARRARALRTLLTEYAAAVLRRMIPVQLRSSQLQ